MSVIKLSIIYLLRWQISDTHTTEVPILLPENKATDAVFTIMLGRPYSTTTLLELKIFPLDKCEKLVIINQSKMWKIKIIAICLIVVLIGGVSVVTEDSNYSLFNSYHQLDQTRKDYIQVDANLSTIQLAYVTFHTLSDKSNLELTPFIIIPSHMLLSKLELAFGLKTTVRWPHQKLTIKGRLIKNDVVLDLQYKGKFYLNP